MIAERITVAVLGARGLVGPILLESLREQGCGIRAYSRSAQVCEIESVAWRPTAELNVANVDRVEVWFCLAPIWILPEYLATVLASGAKRVVAVSSTSRFTKLDSSDPREQLTVKRLIDGERALIAWAESNGVEWVILRTTLIYGFGRDKNVGAVAAFIRRFGFFPLLGSARGLRQPLHAEDLAHAVVAAGWSPAAARRSYDLCGKERLTYRTMIERIFIGMTRRPRLVKVPHWIFRCVVSAWSVARPRSTLSFGMVERMNVDMVFDYSDAVRDLGFSPRTFAPTPDDLKSPS
ncbi:NAD-dependent epimerase/dehydratase family protein [Methyloversatilis sp. XJ19-49]|uniref:NAD-dependent epimerase/dehydratase family protein n=1 Tax=Methyloversatilis sp. XJ19-49 TaxID=2963429 RepID=UPI00211CDCEA|nr:NAD-dependent epimerase/dehydratase family protein [Methyloversatilis sp. XJ19-49]